MKFGTFILLFSATVCLAQNPDQPCPPSGGDAEPTDTQIQQTALDLLKAMHPLTELKKGEVIGKFLDTYYFNVMEENYPGKQTVPVKGPGGKIIAKVTPGFWEHLSVEGTGILRNGKVLNWSEKLNCFVYVEAPMANGTCKLEAFRTVASDPKVIPPGTIIKIDETVGLKLPDGTVHDGIWRVEDSGGDVRNGHLDLYVGNSEANGDVLRNAGIHLKPLTVRYMGTEKDSCATRKQPF